METTDLKTVLRDWFGACSTRAIPTLTPVLDALWHRRAVTWPLLRELGLVGGRDPVADATEAFLESLLAWAYVAGRVGLVDAGVDPWLRRMLEVRLQECANNLRALVGVPADASDSPLLMMAIGGLVLGVEAAYALLRKPAVPATKEG